MAARIYTRTGDAGQTGLFGSRRVPKDDRRIEACGAVDELDGLLGVAAAQAGTDEWRDRIAALQRDLLALGADIATPRDAGETHGGVTVERMGDAPVSALERAIDAIEERLPPLTRFILPGGCPLAASLHLARAVCRRAERRCVTLSRHEPTNPTVVRYLNRLSDLLFVMARAANQQSGIEDVEWR